MLPVGFVVSVDLYVLAGDFFFFFGMGCLQRQSLTPLPFCLSLEEIWFPCSGRAASTRQSVRSSVCASTRAARSWVRAHKQSGPGRPSTSPFCALKNEGGNLRAAVIIHPSKRTGKSGRWRGVGGMDGGRKTERESQRGGLKKGGVCVWWGGYINSYLTVFGVLHPRMSSLSLSLALLRSFLSTVPSFRCLPLRLGVSRIQSGWMCARASVSV